MSYTQNESIDWLTAITPTTDDLVVTMDQAEVWVAKTSTLASIYDLFKTTYDTVYAKYLGDADFYKYSIVTSVASGNLTVALKNYEGNDPTPTKPVKYQDWSGTIRTISSALSVVANSATNYLNCWSAELATKEIDFFVYFQWNTTTSATNLLIARFPSATFMSDITNSNTNEKGAIGIVNYNSTNRVVNIGRFNATLSAGAGYTWSIPWNSVIINSPISETDWRDCNSTISTWWSMTITNVVINHFKYKIVWNTLFFKNNIKMDFWWTTNNYIFETLPFWRILSDGYDISWVWFGYDNADLAPSVIFENTETNKLRIIKLTSAYAVVNNANIRVQWNYQI